VSDHYAAGSDSNLIRQKDKEQTEVSTAEQQMQYIEILPCVSRHISLQILQGPSYTYIWNPTSLIWQLKAQVQCTEISCYNDRPRCWIIFVVGQTRALTRTCLSWHCAVWRDRLQCTPITFNEIFRHQHSYLFINKQARSLSNRYFLLVLN
jgi:hypothetical protein